MDEGSPSLAAMTSKPLPTVGRSSSSRLKPLKLLASSSSSSDKSPVVEYTDRALTREFLSMRRDELGARVLADICCGRLTVKDAEGRSAGWRGPLTIELGLPIRCGDGLSGNVADIGGRGEGPRECMPGLRAAAADMGLGLGMYMSRGRSLKLRGRGAAICLALSWDECECVLLLAVAHPSLSPERMLSPLWRPITSASKSPPTSAWNERTRSVLCRVLILDGVRFKEGKGETSRLPGLGRTGKGLIRPRWEALDPFESSRE